MFGKLSAIILVVNNSTDFVQVLIHGVKYSCPIARNGDKALFRYKDRWYSINDYTNEMTKYIG